MDDEKLSEMDKKIEARIVVKPAMCGTQKEEEEEEEEEALATTTKNKHWHEGRGPGMWEFMT